MGKYVALILAVLVIFCVGFLGAVYFQSDSNPFVSKPVEVDLASDSNLKLLLSDIGWNNASKIVLLSKEGIAPSAIKGIQVHYSENQQPYLQQGDNQGNVFASVNTKFEKDKLTFIVHVDPSRINASQDKNWWITHQVIRAMNKMLNSEAGDEELIEKDRILFDKYKGKINLWEIRF